MSFIIPLFILAVIVTLFSFIDHIRSPFKSKEEPKYVPPVFPPVIAPLPDPEYVPVPDEVIPEVGTVPIVEICPVPAEVKPVEVELFPVPQSQVEEFLSPEVSYPTLDTVVEEEFKTDETQVSKKKHYYYKPKSKK